MVLYNHFLLAYLFTDQKYSNKYAQKTMQTIITKMELIKFEYFKIKLNIVFKKTKCIFWRNFNFKINYFLTCQFKNTSSNYLCETLCTINPKFYCWYLWLFNFDVKEFMVRKFGKTLGHCQYVNINTYFPKKSKLTIFFWNASFSKHKFWWNINLSIHH